jgi:hypothetical protein
MKTIRKPLVILGVFILFKIVQATYAFAVDENPAYLPYLRLTGIFILVPISCLAVKKNVTALRAMGVILLLQTFALLWAIFLIPSEQLIFKALATVMSAYFVFGGYVLVQSGKQEMNN